MNVKSIAMLIRRSYLIVISGTVLLLVACTGVRFGYNHADIFLVASLDEYVDLERAQEKLAKDRISALLAWHRSTQLHAYSALLEEIRTKVKRPITLSEVTGLQQKLYDRLETLGTRAAPELAKLALTLGSGQITRVQHELTNSNAKFRKKFGYIRTSMENKLGARAKPFIKRAEFWLGKLTSEQRTLIWEAMARRDNGNYTWADEREARQRDFLAVLSKIQERKPEEQLATRWIRDYFADLAYQTDPQRRAFVQALRQSNAELIAKVIASATPEQRETLDKKLQDYAADFAALAAEDRKFGHRPYSLRPNEKPNPT
ncbi:DUF6279 family lipoprotein [Methylocaldum sp.]|uniref:DUF6279 family lipoprotein n=1 Tax=Methylocaldum sp. TaxID=1969727 RepID=UPI002D381E7F|nr:DUF6279 family lipoprotein [Methylocaldum sp.]HYE34209.1 DUF6279 family lipoprotein [Methylocaldum sp.]